MLSDKIPRIGSKAQVYHGHARQTPGGLKKKDLMKIKDRIVSRKKHAAGKKAIKHLFSMGYKPKKGTFKLFRKADSKKRSTHKRKTHRRRGGFLDASGATHAMNALKNMMGSK
jgi:hypothetical protein